MIDPLLLLKRQRAPGSAFHLERATVLVGLCISGQPSASSSSTGPLISHDETSFSLGWSVHGASTTGKTAPR